MTELRHRDIHHSLTVLCPRVIRLDKNASDSPRAGVRLHAFPQPDASAGDDQVRSLVREQKRRGLADPRGRAGDDGGLAVESACHKSLLK